ncbi:MAG: NTP transferase domain-containing protein [Candidatus Thorarchaeota archaeon]
MILAAGKGERLGPLSSAIPKALVNVAGKTLLEWAIERHTLAGIDNVVIAVGWKGSLIEKFIVESSLNVRVVHVPNYEIGPLQTFLTAIETFDGSFLLSPVDALVEPATMVGILNHHSDEQLTLGTSSSKVLGTLVQCGPDGIVTAIADNVLNSDDAVRSAMLLIAHTRIRDLCKSALDNGKTRVVQLLDQMVMNGTLISCYEVSHPWFDIDTLSDLLRANQYFLQRNNIARNDALHIPSGDSVDFDDSLSLQPNIRLGKGTSLQGPVLISSDCVIGEDCKIGPNVTIGTNTQVSKGSEITDSVIFGESKVSANCRIHMSVVFHSNMYKAEV